MLFRKIVRQNLIRYSFRKVARSLSRFSTDKESRKQSKNGSGTMKDMKYILVTGGVISGVGKGVIASSFGTLLNCCGISVTSLKIDPYINIDAGTFSPYEHGEFTKTYFLNLF